MIFPGKQQGSTGVGSTYQQPMTRCRSLTWKDPKVYGGRVHAPPQLDKNDPRKANENIRNSAKITIIVTV